MSTAESVLRDNLRCPHDRHGSQGLRRDCREWIEQEAARLAAALRDAGCVSQT